VVKRKKPPKYLHPWLISVWSQRLLLHQDHVSTLTVSLCLERLRERGTSSIYGLSIDIMPKREESRMKRNWLDRQKKREVDVARSQRALHWSVEEHSTTTISSQHLHCIRGRYNTSALLWESDLCDARELKAWSISLDHPVFLLWVNVRSFLNKSVRQKLYETQHRSGYLAVHFVAVILSVHLDELPVNSLEDVEDVPHQRCLAYLACRHG